VARRELPHASLVEGIRFTAQVAVPNVIQGLFRRRKTAAAAATKTNADGLAISFMTGLKRSYGEGALWIRVAKDEAPTLPGVRSKGRQTRSPPTRSRRRAPCSVSSRTR
jgi:hypothetical protein